MKGGCFVVLQLRLVYFLQLLLDLFSVTTHRMMLIFLKPCKYICILQKCRQVKKTPSVLIFKIKKGNLSEVNNVKIISLVIPSDAHLCGFSSPDSPSQGKLFLSTTSSQLTDRIVNRAIRSHMEYSLLISASRSDLEITR